MRNLVTTIFLSFLLSASAFALESFWVASSTECPLAGTCKVNIAAQAVFGSSSTWDGGGADNNWTTAANWVGDVVPSANDELIFPSGAARLISTNDFPIDASFHSLTVNGGGYNITGNAIILTNGITVTAASGGAITIGPNIRLSQAQTFSNTGQAATLSGQLNLNGFGLAVDGPNNYNFAGPITGAGGITKNGTGTLVLQGTDNNYTGITQINNGIVDIRNTNSLGAVGIGSGTVVVSGATLEIGSNTVSVPELITLSGSGVSGSGALRAGNTCATGCSLAGPVSLASFSTINATTGSKLTLSGAIGAAPLSSDYDGAINGGAVGIAKIGSGTLILTNTNSYSGTTEINAGTLLVNGNNSTSNPVNLEGGTLGGSGIVGVVIATGGKVAPGASAGILTAAGLVTFGTGTSLDIEIGGTSVGTQYDRLNGTGGGGISLGTGTANLIGTLINGFIPANGQQFTIIQSTGALTGTFAQGNSVVLSGRRFNIRYNASSVVLTPYIAPFDFDGDRKTDISIFRPAPGEWWYQRSSDLQVGALQFGSTTDRITPGDFTGDGKSDIAFWRPSTGQWFVLRSEDFSFYAFPFGTNGDVPAPADYDGDGKADAAVFRPATSIWFINRSTGGTTIQQFGAAGDVPVTADYDGDGKSDIAIYRPNAVRGAEWWYQNSSNGSVFATQFGTSIDKAVQGDYTGDGKADIAFFTPSTGFWFILRSEDLSFFSFPFGMNGDVPSPGDYDGDGKFDAGVFRPVGTTWFVQRSTAGTLIQQFGAATDIPVPSAFVP